MGKYSCPCCGHTKDHGQASTLAHATRALYISRQHNTKGHPMLRHLPSSIFHLLLLTATGCGIPSFLITPVQNTNELNEITVEAGRGWSHSKIAIIDVEGMLMNAKAGSFLQPTENPV